MGLQDPVFRMSEREILRELFRGARGVAAAYSPDDLPTAGPVSIARKSGQEFRTPSGKLEFYSASLEAEGLPPMPDWQPEPAPDGKLRLLTAPGYFQSHTAFSAVASLRAREGTPFCVMHPADAAARNLADGTRVRLFNEHGDVGLTLRVRDEVQRGIVLVPGQRPDDEAVSGTVNMLCDDRFTDMGAGATYQSTWLDVAAW